MGKLSKLVLVFLLACIALSGPSHANVRDLAGPIPLLGSEALGSWGPQLCG